MKFLSYKKNLKNTTYTGINKILHVLKGAYEIVPNHFYLNKYMSNCQWTISYTPK